MKKEKLKKILATSAMGIVALAMPFALTGCDKNSDINVRVEGEYVQWQIEGEDSWTNLITLDEIVKALGDDLKGEAGADGKKVEFQKSATHIQWRYENGEWQNLIALKDIKGENLVAEECTITYDFNLGSSGNFLMTSINNQLLSVFDKDGLTKISACIENDKINLIYTNKEKKGDYFDLYNFEEM
ncbi:MAG: hypothetical protein ACI4PF_06450, partial [Christensenellales bacterium]